MLVQGARDNKSMQPVPACVCHANVQTAPLRDVTAGSCTFLCVFIHLYEHFAADFSFIVGCKTKLPPDTYL